LTELQPAAKSKERYEQADRRINELYQQLLPKIDKDQQAAFRDDQRDWIKTRDLRAKLYKESGMASAAERRYWQYMVDSTQAQLRHIETDWQPTTEGE
jgi:uncharacterized protein YecT (DUF1311 family)